MTLKELVKWAKENNLEDANIVLNTDRGYENIGMLWEGEQDGGTIMVEPAHVEVTEPEYSPEEV